MGESEKEIKGNKQNQLTTIQNISQAGQGRKAPLSSATTVRVCDMNEYNEDEKTMLTESMAKLIVHIHDSKVQQTEIFHSLTSNDIFKILSNIEDTNPSNIQDNLMKCIEEQIESQEQLRKTSSRFLCELLYDNPEVQDLFCETTGLLPLDGKICVNSIPKSFCQYSKFLPEIFDSIKNSPIFLHQERIPLCWYLTNQIDFSKPIRVQYLFPQELKGRDANEFIDPQEVMFGFILLSIFKESIPNNNINQKSTIKDKTNVYSTFEEKNSPKNKKENTLGSSFIKKIQFNSTSMKQDRILSDKKDSLKQSPFSSALQNESIDQSDQLTQQLNTSRSNSNSKNKSLIQNSSKGKGNQSSMIENQIDDQIEITKLYSPYSLRLDPKKREKGHLPRSKHSQITGKYSLLERRRTTEGVNEKSLRFKQSINSISINVIGNQIANTSNNSMSNNSFRQSFSLQKNGKKREPSDSSSSNKHLANSSATLHAVQVKKFQLQPETTQKSKTNLSNNSSLEAIQLTNLKGQKYDSYSSKSRNTSYQINDKRYSQQPDAKNLSTSLSHYRNQEKQANSSPSNPYNLLSKSIQEDFKHGENPQNSQLFPHSTPKFIEMKNQSGEAYLNTFSQHENKNNTHHHQNNNINNNNQTGASSYLISQTQRTKNTSQFANDRNNLNNDPQSSNPSLKNSKNNFYNIQNNNTNNNNFQGPSTNNNSFFYPSNMPYLQNNNSSKNNGSANIYMNSSNNSMYQQFPSNVSNNNSEIYQRNYQNNRSDNSEREITQDNLQQYAYQEQGSSNKMEGYDKRKNISQK